MNSKFCTYIVSDFRNKFWKFRKNLRSLTWIINEISQKLRKIGRKRDINLKFSMEVKNMVKDDLLKLWRRFYVENMNN